MAHLSRSEVNAILDQHGLPAKTPSTITDWDNFLEELDRVRENDYAFNFGENIEGIHAAGVSVVIEGDVLGTLTIAGAANRLTKEYCETELVPLLKSAVNDMELSYIYG